MTKDNEQDSKISELEKKTKSNKTRDYKQNSDIRKLELRIEALEKDVRDLSSHPQTLNINKEA